MMENTHSPPCSDHHDDKGITCLPKVSTSPSHFSMNGDDEFSAENTLTVGPNIESSEGSLHELSDLKHNSNQSPNQLNSQNGVEANGGTQTEIFPSCNGVTDRQQSLGEDNKNEEINGSQGNEAKVMF